MGANLDMENAKQYKFIDLEKKYKNFYAPCFKIMVEGENLQGAGMEIDSVSVDNTLEGADSFSFTLTNAFDPVKKEFKWFEDFFAPGKKVEISMGYSDKLELMLKGLVTSVRANFPAGGQPSLSISGYDFSYAMMQGKRSHSWEKAKHSDAVQEVLSSYSGISSVVKPTQETHDRIVQNKKSDFEFITELAKANTFEFFASGSSIYFRPPAKNEDPVVTLEWGINLLSFSPEINTSGIVSEVEVRGKLDLNSKKEIVGNAKLDKSILDSIGKSASQLLDKVPAEKVVEHLQYPVKSKEEADRIAKTALIKRASGAFGGSGESLGIPEILAGRSIQLEGLGKKFSGTYYIVKTGHSVSGSGYRTTFEVGG